MTMASRAIVMGEARIYFGAGAAGCRRKSLID